MSKLLSIWLIFMSLIWVWHALPGGNAAKTRGLSSAMELEADLHRWATENASEEAVSEIFDEGRRLLLGGEHPTWSFREMIEHIATDAVPPEWPGIAGLVIGVAGLVQAFTSTVKGAELQLEHMKRTGKFPVPMPGQTIFYVVTPEGVFTYSAKEDDLGNKRDKLLSRVPYQQA